MLCRLKVLDFFEKYPDAGRQSPDAGALEEDRRQAVETIEANVEWASQYRDIIATWLYNNVDISQ